jgi:hypothetical protein
MSAHDTVPCLYCGRLFGDLLAAQRHMADKHRHSFVISEQERQERALRNYDQEKRVARKSRAAPPLPDAFPTIPIGLLGIPIR